MRGVIVYVMRSRMTVAVNDPSRRLTKFNDRLGSCDNCGVTADGAVNLDAPVPRRRFWVLPMFLGGHWDKTEEASAGEIHSGRTSHI